MGVYVREIGSRYLFYDISLERAYKTSTPPKNHLGEAPGQQSKQQFITTIPCCQSMIAGETIHEPHLGRTSKKPLESWNSGLPAQNRTSMTFPRKNHLRLYGYEANSFVTNLNPTSLLF
jgi:hypothetical protein